MVTLVMGLCCHSAGWAGRAPMLHQPHHPAEYQHWCFLIQQHAYKTLQLLEHVWQLELEHVSIQHSAVRNFPSQHCSIK